MNTENEDKNLIQIAWLSLDPDSKDILIFEIFWSGVKKTLLEVGGYNFFSLFFLGEQKFGFIPV